MPDRPGSLAEALITLQARLPRITKDDEAQVGTRKTTYANLATITEAVFPLMTEAGLCWTCRPTMQVEQFGLIYALIHAPSGEKLEGFYPLPNGTPQTIGGAITYARRYALCAVLGIAPVEDDDDAAGVAEAAAARQAARSSAIADERVHTPPHHPRPATRGKGRQPDDEWNTADPDEPGSITDRQRGRLMAAYGKQGISERADRLAYAMSVLDLPELASSNDLSMRQAGELIARLESENQ